jgi:hypothetical protein
VNNYYENKESELFVDPIVANHTNLTKISTKDFNAKLEIKNALAPLTKKEKSDALKMSGVKFEDVLCSAEAEDMWGLSSIKDFIEAGNSTKFVFKNGNTLTLTPNNIAAFQAVWIPFRLGFFK